MALMGADMTFAQSMPTISVLCRNTADLPAPTQEMLCAGLQAALATKYPARQFARAQGAATPDGPDPDGPEPDGPVVTLETHVASPFGLEVQLSWQTKGTDRSEGPRQALSISDKELTPQLQLKFLNRVVQDTTLPF